ncbi:MAG: HpaII family restriction endonuclease [Candidatus Kapaibacterium sp.]
MEVSSLQNKPKYISLNGVQLAEYNFVYKVVSNNKFAGTDIGYDNSTTPIYQGLDNKIMEFNLRYVDSTFAQILADVALKVYFNKIVSFKDYMRLPNKINIVDIDRIDQYFTYKFYTFIHDILYTNLTTQKYFDREINSLNVYTANSSDGKVDKFYYHDYGILYKKLVDELTLQVLPIPTSKSSNELRLCLKIVYNKQ